MMTQSEQHYRNFIANKHLTAKSKAWLAWSLVRAGKSAKATAFELGISTARVYSLLKSIGKGKKARRTGLGW